jgi:hypothetical protein
VRSALKSDPVCYGYLGLAQLVSVSKYPPAKTQLASVTLRCATRTEPARSFRVPSRTPFRIHNNHRPGRRADSDEAGRAGDA